MADLVPYGVSVTYRVSENPTAEFTNSSFMKEISQIVVSCPN